MLASSLSATDCHRARNASPRSRRNASPAPQHFCRRRFVRFERVERVEHDGQPQFGQVVPDRANLADMALRNDGHRAARMEQPELEVVEFVDLDRHRNVDRAAVEDAEFGHHPVVAALRDERHAVAFRQSEAEQASREPVDALAHVGVRRALVAVAPLLQQHDGAGVALHAVLEKPGKRSRFGHGAALQRWCPSATLGAIQCLL